MLLVFWGARLAANGKHLRTVIKINDIRPALSGDWSECIASASLRITGLFD